MRNDYLTTFWKFRRGSSTADTPFGGFFARHPQDDDKVQAPNPICDRKLRFSRGSKETTENLLCPSSPSISIFALLQRDRASKDGRNIEDTKIPKSVKYKQQAISNVPLKIAVFQAIRKQHGEEKFFST